MCVRSVNSLWLLLAATVVLQSCSSGESTGEAVQLVSDDFVTYQLDINSDAIPFSQLVNEVELMRLEETDQSLLAYVTWLHETDDSYVFPSGRDGDVFVYSKQGEFKSKMNRKGDGPEEYGNITSMWLEDGGISIYSSGKMTLKRYDLNGNFRESIELKENGDQLMPFEDGYVMDMAGRPVGDTLKYNIQRLNQDFEEDELFLPFEKSNQVSISSSMNGFRAYKSGLSYLGSLSDTLHYLDNDGARPLMKFDFGNEWLWKDDQLLNNNGEAFEAMQNRGLIWNLGVSLSPSLVYLACFTDFSTPKSIMIDRQTGSYNRISFGKGEDALSISALYWVGDRMLMSIASDQVEDFLSQLDDQQWTLREGTTLDAIESSEHRVMMWVRFKEGGLSD